jgi:hypothetical protein
MTGPIFEDFKGAWASMVQLTRARLQSLSSSWLPDSHGVRARLHRRWWSANMTMTRLKTQPILEESVLHVRCRVLGP